MCVYIAAIWYVIDRFVINCDVHNYVQNEVEPEFTFI